MAERWNADNFKEKINEKDKLVLVDFYSDSCVPCKRMSPVLAELEETYVDQLSLGKVNIAYEETLVETYEVSAAPTLVFFKNGEELTRLTGVQKKADLVNIIEENK